MFAEEKKMKTLKTLQFELQYKNNYGCYLKKSFDNVQMTTA